MKEVSLVFPHQLFEDHPSLKKERPVYLVEEFLFFRQYNFHKQKLAFHRASMKYYKDLLTEKGYQVSYIESNNPLSNARDLIRMLSGKEGVEAIHYTDTTDNWLEKRMRHTTASLGIQLIRYGNPGFLNLVSETNSFFSGRKNYFQTDFYIHQRKQRNILLEKNNRPSGGKWTFDSENRLKFPAKEKLPAITFPGRNKYINEALIYVKKNFPGNYGTLDEFLYPVTHDDAVKWLDDFLQYRFEKFGIYEDAMLENESILHHSVLTPVLNTGLLTPQFVLDKAIEAGSRYTIPLNSLEGFIRQIMGWREFIRLVYEREGSKQRTTNYWKFTRKIPASFWTGETGIHPVDTVIKRLLKTGYTHHIERLMVLGNFMLLCEFDPDDVYRWFMEMYIDSYDWVMVPNVYGMSQFADGGLMTTKPYISGSNYLLKMGNWEKGEWQQVWDGLFWRFMHVHRDFFLSNPRLGMLVKTFDKMPAEKRELHLAQAHSFLNKLE